jgi:hypothetical protein
LLDEEANGGHAIAQHVGKSESYLIRRSESTRFQLGSFARWQAFGSFTTLNSAGALVNSTISEHTKDIDEFIKGNDFRKVLESRFNVPTGYEAYAASPNSSFEIRPTYWVRVVLLRDRNRARGYTVLTAFPYSY